MIDDQINALLDDPDFSVIRDRMRRFNLFEAVGSVHSELRHSNFLAYLLSPNRPHGLGSRPLHQVLRYVLEAIPPAQRPILADPNHPDHDEVKEWLGDYDPGAFDEQPVRQRLARIAARRSAPKKAKTR